MGNKKASGKVTEGSGPCGPELQRQDSTCHHHTVTHPWWQPQAHTPTRTPPPTAAPPPHHTQPHPTPPSRTMGRLRPRRPPLLLLLLLLLLLPTTLAAAAGNPPPPTPKGTLQLANTLGSHMVLQQAPLPACLYGQGSPQALISLTLDSDPVPSAVTLVDRSDPIHPPTHLPTQPTEQQKRELLALILIYLPSFLPQSTGKWVACLPPQPSGGPHTLEIKGSGGVLRLEDILFGEVWLCSGRVGWWVGG